MTIETDLFAAIRARVSDRAYPVVAPGDPTLPYAVYQRVASVPVTDLVDGKGQLQQSRFQIDVWDADYAAAHATAELIASDVCGAAGFKAVRLSSPMDFGFEEETSMYRVSQDFSIAHT